MASFGEKLKEAREGVGLTQAQLADRSGIPLGTIREYEQNKREPLVSKAAKLAHALNRTIETLLATVEPSAPRGRPRKGAASPEPPPAKGKKGKGK